MIRVRIADATGAARDVMATDGEVLLRVAQADGWPLEGTCEGQMACSTCHVIVATEDFARLPRASEEEEDLLDLAPSACRTSRLSCQIVLTAALDGLSVTVPSERRDMGAR